MMTASCLLPLSHWSCSWTMNSTILLASAVLRVTVAFDGIRVDTLATPGPGAIEDTAGPGMVDGEGPGATGWTTTTFMVADKVGLLLVVVSVATSSSSGDGGILMLGGAT